MSRRLPFAYTAVLILSHIGAAQTLRLDGDGLSVDIDAHSGALQQVRNTLSNESYTLSGPALAMETASGEFLASEVRSVEKLPNGAAFHYDLPGLRGIVRYELPAASAALRKTIELVNTDDAPVLLQRIVPWRLDFRPAFQDVHAHHDPSKLRWLINLFLRGVGGGFYLGVENSISESLSKGSTPDSTWLQIHYAPRIELAPGERHVADVAFLGAFRKEGVYLFKEIRKLQHALKQPKAIPAFLDLTPEILDWGEVWAMQDYVLSRQPPRESERPGFYVRAVAMVGGRKSAEIEASNGFHIPFGPEHVEPSKQFTDEVVRLGHIPHIEWSTEWFGLGGYVNPTPGLALENAVGLDVPVNPHWLEVVRHGWDRGVKTGIFETVTRNFARSREEWKVRLPNGEPWYWKDDLPVNCWANPDYVQWRLDVTDKAVRDYRLYMVAYDAIVPVDWSWLGWPDMRTECHASNHGHLPGNVAYPIFRNIKAFLRDLQQRHPKLALRVASGLTTAYPWVLENLIEYHPNFYDGETGATYWTSYNFRFLPMYKSGVLLSATNKADFEWLLLRSISVSDHFMLWPDALPNALENKPFWTKWLTWADRHIDYLRVGRTLFREPWGDDVVASLPPALEGRLPSPESEIHGSAHILRDHGFVFLFNPDSAARVASFPVNHWLGLSKGNRFEVRTLYPQEDAVYGPYLRGEQVRIELPARSAFVLELAESTKGAPPRYPEVSSGAPVDKAFLRWDELPFADLHITP